MIKKSVAIILVIVAAFSLCTVGYTEERPNNQNAFEFNSHYYMLIDSNYSEPPSNSQKPILLHKLTNNILHTISFDC